jgi:hypothetical protein
MVIISPCPKKRPKSGILERIPPTFVDFNMNPEKYTISMRRRMPKPGYTGVPGRTADRIAFPVLSALLNKRKTI